MPPVWFSIVRVLIVLPRSVLASLALLAMPPIAAVAQDAASAPLYHLAVTWKVPGDGACRRLAVDANARRLYVAREDRVQVLNADTGELVGEITALDGARGIALAPRIGRGFVTSAHANAVLVFDLKTLTRIGDSVPVGTNPDAVVYVPGRDKIFAFNVGDKTASVFDAKDGKTLGTVALGGKPASAVAEGGGRVFVNLEDQDEALAIDVDTLAVENRYSLKTGKRPTGLSIDPDGGRIFIGCGNEKMVVMATEDGTIMSIPAIGKGADATAFDTRAKLALAANAEDGTLTVVDAYKASPKAVGTIPARRGARALAIDQKTHAVFLAAADFEPPLDSRGNPKTVPDSFAILKYDYDGPRK